MKFKYFTKKLIIFLAFGFRAGESGLEHLTVWCIIFIMSVVGRQKDTLQDADKMLTLVK